MMSDFETALEHKDHMQSGEAHELRQEGFRRQDKRIVERAELTKDEQAESSNLLTALLVTGDTRYAARLQELNERVGYHQNATIEALLDNQERLDEMQERLDHLLATAYELPDGRKVFETEDGQRVFDQHGNALSLSEIDPDQIPDHHPSWETWTSANDANDALRQERQELLAYQDKLDQAQTLIDQGGLSADDFDDLDNLMTSNVPDAVRARLPASDPAFKAPQASTSNLDDRFDFSDLSVTDPASRMSLK
ncbi:hypothetical protein [uncultured Roseobacter sp.]|uniref:hypothetical protein n=1 Tax=uncultured Roseobacter sp. TaxID=114847 RepID=UPI00260978E0|nr:hypothetical protein [uncultured Roseobacter sp.]